MCKGHCIIIVADCPCIPGGLLWYPDKDMFQHPTPCVQCTRLGHREADAAVAWHTGEQAVGHCYALKLQPGIRSALTSWISSTRYVAEGCILVGARFSSRVTGGSVGASIGAFEAPSSVRQPPEHQRCSASIFPEWQHKGHCNFVNEVLFTVAISRIKTGLGKFCVIGNGCWSKIDIFETSDDFKGSEREWLKTG